MKLIFWFPLMQAFSGNVELSRRARDLVEDIFQQPGPAMDTSGCLVVLVAPMMGAFTIEVICFASIQQMSNGCGLLEMELGVF
jgi:hypothetical protein